MSTIVHRQSIEFLTPLLLAGAHQARPEWRGASLHGQLHFWARVLACHPDEDADAMLQGEVRLMGGALKQGNKLAPQAGPFAVWLAGPAEPQPAEYPNCPHDVRKGRRAGMPPGSEADLYWSPRASAAWGNGGPGSDEALTRDFLRLLRNWILLGALGLRANRAAGSVWIPGWSPTPDEFSCQVENLELPAAVEVRLLPPVSAMDVRDWRDRLAYDARHYLEQSTYAEQLRGIATDSVRGSHQGDIPGDPLGYAGQGSDRKASPLKLKVGRFSDGLRLIAVHDDRHGRGGRLADAMDALSGKLLGKLLRDGQRVGRGSSAPAADAAPAGGGDSVACLLAGKYDYAAIQRYGRQVQEWLQAGRLDLVAEFIRATQAPAYSGLRQQPWYAQAQAAVATKS